MFDNQNPKHPQSAPPAKHAIRRPPQQNSIVKHSSAISPSFPNHKAPILPASSTQSPGTRPTSPKSLSDKELYSKCQEYGGNAKKWLQKFAGLLPEVYHRFLYKKHGCGSIHEFAQKLSGMHERTVKKILHLHERLYDKPHLLALFESGEQGWSKLEAVAFITTPETERDFAERVRTLPQKALYLWVKNFRDKLTVDGQSRLDNNLFNLQTDRANQGAGGQAQHAADQLPLLQEIKTPSSLGLPPSNSYPDPNSHDPSFTTTNSDHDQAPHDLDFTSAPSLMLAPSSPSQTSDSNRPASGLSLTPTSPLLPSSGQPATAASPYSETFTSFSFPISIRSRQKLNIVKLTLEKQHKQTLTWNQVIDLWPIHNQKIIVKKVCPTCALKLAKNPAPTCIQPLNHPTHKSPPSRHIPEPIKNFILATHGQTCAFPNCNKAFTEFHHTKPFAIYKSHHPNHIFPVCSTHHALFHAGLIENSNKSPQHWFIRSHARQTTIDKKAMKFKMQAKQAPPPKTFSLSPKSS